MAFHTAYQIWRTVSRATPKNIGKRSTCPGAANGCRGAVSLPLLDKGALGMMFAKIYRQLRNFLTSKFRYHIIK